MGTLGFDVETNRYPDGSAYRESAELISWASSIDEEPIIFSYYTDPDFISLMQEQFDKATILVGVNLKYDVAWARRKGVRLPKGLRIFDLQLAEFVLSGQTNSFASMDDLCKLYGFTGKEGGLEDFWNQGIETRDIPKAIIEEYNLGDTSRTLQIYHAQLKDSRMTPALHKLILLQGADLLVLQQMEQNGILYDVGGSIKEGDSVLQRVNEIKKELDELVGWPGFNFDSGDHLSCWLYGGVVSLDIFEPVKLVYKSGPRIGQAYTQQKFQRTETKEFEGLFKPLKKTELKKPGMYQTGEPILRQLPTKTKQQKRVIELLLSLAELSKQVGSFLHALPKIIETKGWADNIIHSTYNQCIARTGRLSSSSPNAQQWPEVVDQFWKSRYE